MRCVLVGLAVTRGVVCPVLGVVRHLARCLLRRRLVVVAVG